MDLIFPERVIRVEGDPLDHDVLSCLMGSGVYAVVATIPQVMQKIVLRIDIY